MKGMHAFQQNASEYTFFLCFTVHASECQWSIESWLRFTSNLCIFCPHRATIEEVEGDVCELESKLDKVSTAHEKHCLIVRFLHRVSQQQHKPSCNRSGLSSDLSSLYSLAFRARLNESRRANALVTLPAMWWFTWTRLNIYLYAKSFIVTVAFCWSKSYVCKITKRDVCLLLGIWKMDFMEGPNESMMKDKVNVLSRVSSFCNRSGWSNAK